MFKWNRVLVALIGIPLLVFIYTNISFKGFPLFIFSLFVVGVGLSEFYKMIEASGKEVYNKFGIVAGLLVVFVTYYNNVTTYFLVGTGKLDEFLFWFNYYFGKLNIGTINIIILTVMILLVYRVFRNKIKGTLDSVAYTLLGIIYVAVFFSQIINLYFVDYNYYEISGVNPKITLIMILQILVWVSDTAAGAVGVSIGRKFFKNGFTEISPKKSVEGSIGSLLFTGLATVIIGFSISSFSFNIKELIIFFIIGLIISCVAQIGDLVESLFKRECGVKDSGTILMGHGGVLDRFDSMLLVLPFVSYFLPNF